MIKTINLLGSLSGELLENSIKFKDGIKFHIENETLFIESEESNSISINGDYVCGNVIMGDKIVIKNNNTNINIFGNNITINGKKVEDLKIDKKEDSNKIYEYKFENNLKLERINLSGSTYLEINEKTNTIDLKKINTSGASKIKIKSQCKNDLYLNSSGASTIKLNNNDLESLELNTSGASKIKLENINVKNLQIESSGASTVKGNNVKYNNINKSKSIAASISL